MAVVMRLLPKEYDWRPIIAAASCRRACL